MRLLLFGPFNNPLLCILLESPAKRQMQIDAGDELRTADVDERDSRADGSGLHLQGREKVNLTDLILGLREIPGRLVFGQDLRQEPLALALEPSSPTSAPPRW